MMDMVVLDQAEHTSHTTDNTGLLTVVDMAASYDMASHRLLRPSMILTPAYGVPLHLCRTLYLLHCEIMIVLFIIIFAERDSAAFTVADLAILDDPSP